MENNKSLQKISPVWQRAIYMLLFLLVISLVKVVAYAVVALQFLFVLVGKSPNEHLLALGKSLSTYTYQIMLFLTFNSEELPYPFRSWPK